MNPEEIKKETLKYGILGEDNSSPQEKLEKFSGITSWEYLKPHYEAGVLYHLDSSITIKDAGLAFSTDDTKKVESWLSDGSLVKIEALHAFQWDSDEESKKEQFEALVVSPFVLCQLKNKG